MPIDGGPPRQVTFMNSECYCPVWSPDGRELAFISFEGGTYQVWTVGSGGGAAEVFENTRVGESRRLAWAPGKNILYAGVGNRNLMLLDPHTGNESPLVENAAYRGASPDVLERNGLADWLQAAHPEARVVSVSAKPRAAVLMAAHSRAQAYWFEAGLGRFASSVHYMNAYPEWFEDFNRDVVPTFAADSVWELAVPAAFRSLARRDAASWEGDGVHTAFPHAFVDSEYLASQGAFWEWWAGTPPLDRATRLLAQTAVEAEGLGEDAIPDLLAISFSQTDRVGHAYGPRSLEQLDNLYRLDQELGEMLAWLDDTLGPDGYVLLLTADHGIMDSPEITVAEGGWGLRITRDSAVALQQVVNQIAREVGMDDAAALSRGLAEAMPKVSWIEQSWTFAELSEIGPAADSFTVMQARSTFPGRPTGLLARQGLEFRFAENTLLWAYPRGTTHGSAYYYDRQVPFILHGAGIPAGASPLSVSVNDVAPTLAAILGLEVPDDLDGVARRAGEGAEVPPDVSPSPASAESGSPPPG
jgi:predicted AlkP superfamily pyrophosphatase or phosphodiesterase